ncbi:molecular chaperone Tir [Longimonas halophila]|uniref:Molecular chaperone Tir n=1 Tax=Longimonas halophila TaxID=1469170 RepID=A0A2H3P040_9BACT|nr:molecular chaperone Tir [Longimonas halophila]
MAYRNKTFVSFDSEDLHYYRLMCAWKENEGIDFHFLDAHDLNTARDTSQPKTIKRRLRERLSNTKQVVMLIGDNTRQKAARSYSFLHYEVTTIVDLEIPVVFANLNKCKESESHRIPKALLDRYSMSVAFGPSIIKYALDNFPSKYHDNLDSAEDSQKTGPYYYKKSVYTKIQR